ncbi:Serine/threonine-protein kinase GRIK1 [Taenia solium]|eukprot:TsM_000392300 transcript=TsM_000392300 gene=TsM_000392300
MEYAKQGPYISKVIHYQMIDDHGTSERIPEVNISPLRSSSKSSNRYYIKYFRSQELLANEYNIHKRLAHRNIIQLIGVYQSPSDGLQGLDEIVCKNMSAYRICVGFLTPSSTVRGHPSLTLRPFQVHSIGVIHRDIKPENMMIDNNNEIQLIDFGSSLVFESRDNDKVRGTIGTPAFLAPECVQDTGEAYSGKKADIWAVGMTLALMLTGKLPYDGLTKYDVIEAIRTKPLNIKKSELFGCINTHAIEFLTNALNRNPKERLDALQLKVQ